MSERSPSFVENDRAALRLAREDDSVPVVVDLDDTLVRTDLLVESVLLLLHTSIRYLWWLPVWLMQGKAALKREVARRVELDASMLPYDSAILAYLEEARQRGRRVVLATAADRRLAEAVAQHLGLFSEVFASDGTVNLAGERKLRVLRERFGERGFDYIADGYTDLPVWAQARRAVLVGANARLRAAVGRVTEVERSFEREHVRLATYVRAIRVHQWLKNGLLFVPLIAAHRFTDWMTITQVLIGFIAFCLCASSVYLLNDLMDLQDDRRHPTKRERPLASGRLPLTHAAALIPLLLLVAILAALALPAAFLVTLAGYYALTLAYSLGLKRLAIVDVLVLAFLYTLRLIAGGAAGSIELSFWLLALAVFLFLSLALAKRCAELALMQASSQSHARGRGYRTDDLALLYSLGGASGYVAILVLALYVNSEQVTLNYSRPELIWLLCPVLLYWVSRLWLKVVRGEMHDDPVVFAARDPGSHIVGLISVLLLWLAV